MKILVIGSGAREHALVDALGGQVWCAPGNGGTPRTIPWRDNAEDARGFDLVVVGPEAPLAAGLADRLQELRIPVFGPCQRGARLESSKAFAKEFMQQNLVPTARYEIVTSMGEAERALARFDTGVVVKASGLAAGKGVFVCSSQAEARQALRQLLDERVLGAAGDEVVLEERLSGSEVSLLAVVSGDRYRALPLACDYKRAFDGDQGPNTGGMGAYSPPAFAAEAAESVMPSIMRGLQGLDYVGVLYVGLMMTPQGPRVLEFNVRFGDPETQVVLPRLKTPLVDIVQAAVAHEPLPHIETAAAAACGVVVTAPEYPVRNIDGVLLPELPPDGVKVYHAGTRQTERGLEASGGRIFTVVATGDTLGAARRQVYDWLAARDLSPLRYRADIAGHRAEALK